MRPQESLRERSYSRASDVYMFGMLIIELFSGNHPWMPYSNADVIASKCNGQMHPPLLPSVCPPEVWAIITKASATDHRQRPTMEQVNKMLRGLTDPRFAAEAARLLKDPGAGAAAAVSTTRVRRFTAGAPTSAGDVAGARVAG